MDSAICKGPERGQVRSGGQTVPAAAPHACSWSSHHAGTAQKEAGTPESRRGRAWPRGQSVLTLRLANFQGEH